MLTPDILKSKNEEFKANGQKLVKVKASPINVANYNKIAFSKDKIVLAASGAKIEWPGAVELLSVKDMSNEIIVYVMDDGTEVVENLG